MKKLLVLLMLLTGCLADTEPEEDFYEVPVVETEPSAPEGALSKGPSGPDLCAPILREAEVDGVIVLIPVPVECHPVEPLDTQRGDDYTEGSKPGLPDQVFPEANNHDTEQY